MNKEEFEKLISPSFSNKRCELKKEVVEIYHSHFPNHSKTTSSLRVYYFLNEYNIAYSYDINHFRTSNGLIPFKNNFNYTEICDLFNKVNKKIPICVWSSSIYSKFMSMQTLDEFIYVEVPKYSIEFVKYFLASKGVFELSSSSYADLIYKGIKIVLKTYNEYNPIEMKVCTTGNYPDYYEAKIEKIIVDLYANKFDFISDGDKYIIIKQIFSKYQVNITTLLSYARSRNKKELFLYLLNKLGFADEKGQIIYD